MIETQREGEGGSDHVVPETLEVVHGQGVALNPGTTNELGQHIKGNFDAGHGFGNTNGDDEDDAENETVEDDARRCVGLPAGDTANTEAYGDGEEEKVPPLRNCRLRKPLDLGKITRILRRNLVLLTNLLCISASSGCAHLGIQQFRHPYFSGSC